MSTIRCRSCDDQFTNNSSGLCDWCEEARERDLAFEQLMAVEEAPRRNLNKMLEKLADDLTVQPLPRQMPVTAPDLGTLSADAVMAEYKAAADAVEQMGEEVQARIRALEAALQECHADMELLREAANAVREKGNHARVEIERTTSVSRHIREIVSQIKAKL